MPRKCCVPLCKSNYKTGESVTAFRFPSYVEQTQLWKTAIPRNWNITSNTVVCAKHWPIGFESYQHYGKIRPVNPPSVFPHVPKSCVTHVPQKRATEKSLVENRSIIADQMQEFSSSDALARCALRPHKDDTKHQKKNVIHEHLHVVGLPDGDDNSLFRVLCYFKSSLLSFLQRLPIALRKNSYADNIEV